MKLKAVIFDLFGTLVLNLEHDHHDALQFELAALLDAPIAEFVRLWSEDFPRRMNGELQDGPEMFDDILKRLKVTASTAQIHAADDRRRQFMLAAMKAKPDALSSVRALQELGLQLGLATDCSSQTPELFHSTELGQHFSAVAASALLGTTKPDAIMYQHVTEQLGVDLDQCLYVGDGNSFELRGAKALGMTTVWVDNGEQQFFKSRFDSQADHSIQMLDELPALCHSLRK